MEVAMSLAAFDIEIAQEIPDGEVDWARVRPGISCAAIALEGAADTRATADPRAQPALFDQSTHALTRDGVSRLVDALLEVVRDGFTIVTWNGVGFDFAVLAEQSGRRAECAELAWNSIDMMFHLFCAKGHPLALDTALAGMNLEGKVHAVKGEDGQTIEISGKEAPRLWQAGEYAAVLTYCAADVRRTLELAQVCARRGYLAWTSRAGKLNRLDLSKGGWLPARECVKLPEPDTSWMRDPPTRARYVGWMK
jgi:hypothetical protein